MADMRCAGSVLRRIRCLRCGGRAFCRIAAEIGRGITAFSGRRGHADRIVAGGAGWRACPGEGFVRAQGPATDISRLRGPIQSETGLTGNV